MEGQSTEIALLYASLEPFNKAHTSCSLRNNICTTSVVKAHTHMHPPTHPQVLALTPCERELIIARYSQALSN